MTSAPRFEIHQTNDGGYIVDTRNRVPRLDFILFYTPETYILFRELQKVVAILNSMPPSIDTTPEPNP